MKRKIFLATCLLTAFLAVGCTDVPLRNLDNVSIKRADGKPATMADVEKAIQVGAAEKGWNLQDLGPGHLMATHNQTDDSGDSFGAVIEIRYTDHDYSLDYKDSHGLKYNPTRHTIHMHYKLWQSNLREAIDQAMVKITSGG